VKMDQREKLECLVFLEKVEDLDLLDRPEILAHKVSKVTLVTEALQVKLDQWANQDFLELLENLGGPERTDWMDYLVFLEKWENLVDQDLLGVLEQLVCPDQKENKESKDLLVSPVKWEDLALLEKLDLKEKLENKAFKVFKVSPENLDDLVLPDPKVCRDLKALADPKEMMDHKVHLDFLEREADKESKDTRVILELLEQRDLQVILDPLECLENLDARVNQELPVNVDLLVYLVRMDNVDQLDQPDLSDQKDPEVSLDLEELKDLVVHVEDLDVKDLLVNLQVIKKFWKSVAELSRMKWHVPWPHLDQRVFLLDHPDHLVILDIRVTKDLLARQDLQEPMEFKANLDCKDQVEFPVLKAPSETKEIKELPLLEHPEKLVYLDLLVLKVLLVMEGMVAMAKVAHLD